MKEREREPTITLRKELGPMRFVARGDALVSLWFVDGPEDGDRDDLLDRAIGEIDEYFALERTEFSIPVAPEGTPFQRDVWNALRSIPFGETRSYADVARTIGKPKAVRAVGAANGRNPLGIVVPCHRVIGADGSLTGYAGGMERKKFLLDLERHRFVQKTSEYSLATFT
jgi:methylated-DNA-[protein]-cysteine S-methyltransferase